MVKRLRLDDLYHMTAYIYSERNAERSLSTTFTHFVEVCGALTAPDRQKSRDALGMTDALCKALGWFFPLLARCGISSAEELIFRKYPGCCPYCLRDRHEDVGCKSTNFEGTANRTEVRERFSERWRKRPTTLDQWQAMFQAIYQRQVTDGPRSALGLFEELGELAEAVRVFEKHPKYLVGEAADVFSYLMGVANQHLLRERSAPERRVFSFQAEFVRRYPGLCLECGYQVCKCPAIPQATVGRLAKEMDIGEGDRLFLRNSRRVEKQALEAADVALEQVGGYSAVAHRFLDRGDANRAFVMLCVRLADTLEASQADLAARLRSEAARAGRETTPLGQKEHSRSLDGVVQLLQQAWPALGVAAFRDDASLVGRIGRLFQPDACRFGIVAALPKEFAAVRAMLDDSRPCRIEGDPNDYAIGTIAALDGSGSHWIALVMLKETGAGSAASTVANLLRSFKNVRDVLMVGIAGGVPHPSKSADHVRLGDVVVSSDGVVQYVGAVGGANAGLPIRYHAAKPSAFLVGKVNMIEADMLGGRRPWENHFTRCDGLESATRPDDSTDILSSTEPTRGPIPHPTDPSRRAGLPRIHRGRIATTHAVLRDAKIRDELRDAAGIKAVEMEGSGIADGAWLANQRYMIIRGICDYCDWKKGDLWQGYAAVAAAAYTRALLEHVSVKEVDGSPPGS